MAAGDEGLPGGPGDGSTGDVPVCGRRRRSAITGNAQDLAIAGQIILAETSFTLSVQLLVTLGGITILVGLGTFLSWYKTLTARAASAPREQAVTA